MRYFIKTYGCQMNKADSERISAHLEKSNYFETQNFKEADLIILNSCVVRQGAEDSIYGWGQKISKFKIQNSKLKIILTGCLVGKAKEGRKERISKSELRKKLPWVDEFWPIGKIGFEQEKKRLYKKSALIPIMEGCDNFCTYCVVPYTRGKERSRSIDEILKEVQALVKGGVTEITLLGQNVNSYKANLEVKSQNAKLKLRIEKLSNKYKDSFAILLEILNEIEDLEIIKFLTSHPKDMSDEVIEAISSCQKVEKYLHLPIQSGDDEILKKMNRGYTVSDYRQLVEKIKSKIPEIQIGTDIIVGFPGETEKQFENTCKIVKEMSFSPVFIGIYSPREGTAAYNWGDPISKAEKLRRHKILNQLVNDKR